MYQINHLNLEQKIERIEINYQSGGTYSVNKQIRFKTTMLKSSLCDYIDAYILVNGRITITGDAGPAAGTSEAQLLAARQVNERDKGVIFENYALFINCKTKVNNAEIDNAKDIDIVMPVYSLIKYSDNYSKTSGSLWQYYRDEPNDNLTDSESFKS